MKVDRRSFLAGASSLALINRAEAARFPGGSEIHGWNNAKVGAGGLITGIDIAPDGTVVARADVFGGYIYNRSAVNPGNAGGTGVWQQLITTTSMAAYMPLVQTPLQAADGLYEIRVAPSNSQIIYMVYLGFVWISTNQGATWTQTAFTRDTTMVGNTGLGERVYQYKMAVDPINPDVVYLATSTNGAKKTLNGTTAARWVAIATVPSNNAYELGCVAIDPSSSTISGRKSVVYISVSGSGLYKSTDGGVTFASVTGGPGTTSTIQELQVSGNGTLFAVDFNTNKLWRLVGSTWTDITPRGSGTSINAVSINPSNADNVIAWTYNNGGRETTTASSGTPGGGMWAALNGTTPLMIAADTPMIGTLLSTFFTAGMLSPRWDPSDTTKIWCSANQGAWQIAYPLPASPTRVVFNSVSAGIEEIVANDIVVPPGGDPIFFGWDVGAIPQPNLLKYAPAQAWNTGSFLSFGAGGDYASNDPTFVCGIFDKQGTEATGYSTSLGAPGTWKAFPSFPPGSNRTHFSGCIAASTNQEMIWVQAQGGLPWYTSNRGVSWSHISGLPTDDSWDHNAVLKRHIVAADRVNIGAFYLMNSNGNGGASSGTYVISNGGATVVYHANTIDLGANSRLRTVPGNAGHLFFTSGPQGSGGDPASNWPHAQLFYYSHDGGATWNDVGKLSSNHFTIREVWDFGLGAPKPGGGGYPVIYIYGFVAAGFSPPRSGSTPAFWKSEDNGRTWVQIGSQFPLGWPDFYATVNGDPNIYGQVYAGGTGSGWIYLAP